MSTPRNWESRTLGSLGTVLRGKGIKRSDVRTIGIPCVRYGELYTEYRNYMSTTRSFVDAEIAATSQPISKGDLLFAGSGETREEIGMCAAYVGDSQAVAGGDIVIVRGGTFNPIFLASLCNSPSVVRQKARSSQGDAVVHIYPSGISDIVVALPPKAEQDTIANAILDADTLIATLERLIAKKQAIKQGLVQQLLTGRTRLPGFTEAWSKIRLGNHVSYVKTVALSRAQLDRQSPLKYLHYGDIHTRSSILLDAAIEEMPRANVSLAARAGQLRRGDLVFADASEDPEGVGKSIEIADTPDTGVVPGLHTIAARFDKSVLADGFKAYLQFIPSFRDQLLRLAAGTKVLATTRSYISSITLTLPAVAEQNAIAQTLHDSEREIEALRVRLLKAQDMKTGMMQQLLAGRCHLPLELPHEH